MATFWTPFWERLGGPGRHYTPFGASLGYFSAFFGILFCSTMSRTVFGAVLRCVALMCRLGGRQKRQKGSPFWSPFWGLVVLSLGTIFCLLCGDPVSTPRAPRKEYSSEPGPPNGSEMVPKMEPRQQGPTLSKRVPACTDCILRLLLEGPFSLPKRALGKREHPYSIGISGEPSEQKHENKCNGGPKS